jgi:hypothetical protein
MERLIKSDSTVTQMWNPITLRNPGDGGDMFPKMAVQLELHGMKSRKVSIPLSAKVGPKFRRQVAVAQSV